MAQAVGAPEPAKIVFDYLRGTCAKNMETFMKVHRQLNLDPDLMLMNKNRSKTTLTAISNSSTLHVRNIDNAFQ